MHPTQDGLLDGLDMPPAETLSKKGFAERLGVTPARVSQMITAGLPVERSGRIRISTGLAWVEANVDSNRRRAGSPSPDTQPLAQGSSRAQRDAADARIAQLKAERLAGSLINSRTALRWIEGRARMERDSWIAWTSRAAPEIATQTGADIAIVMAALDRLVRDQLASLAARPMEGLGR